MSHSKVTIQSDLYYLGYFSSAGGFIDVRYGPFPTVEDALEHRDTKHPYSFQKYRVLKVPTTFEVVEDVEKQCGQ